jgi:hypothetical protein
MWRREAEIGFQEPDPKRISARHNRGAEAQQIELELKAVGRAIEAKANRPGSNGEVQGGQWKTPDDRTKRDRIIRLKNEGR